jgi:DNA-binding IclR family transcriptional regulator
MAMVFHAHTARDAPVAGTVSIAGPLTRLTDKHVHELAPLLRRAAQELSELWPLHVRQREDRPSPARAA